LRWSIAIFAGLGIVALAVILFLILR